MRFLFGLLFSLLLRLLLRRLFRFLGLGLWLYRLFDLVGQFLHRAFGRFAQILAGAGHFLLDAVQYGADHQFAIKVDGADGVVVARHRKVDSFGFAVGIDDSDNRNVQLIGLGDGNGLLIGVDNHQDIRQGTHFLDAAERPFELGPLPGKAKKLFFGQANGFPRQLFVEVPQALDGI